MLHTRMTLIMAVTNRILDRMFNVAVKPLVRGLISLNLMGPPMIQWIRIIVKTIEFQRNVDSSDFMHFQIGAIESTQIFVYLVT